MTTCAVTFAPMLLLCCVLALGFAWATHRENVENRNAIRAPKG